MQQLLLASLVAFAAQDPDADGTLRALAPNGPVPVHPTGHLDAAPRALADALRDARATIRPTRFGHVARNAAQALRLEFDAGRTRVAPLDDGAWSVAFELVGLGRADDLGKVAPPATTCIAG